MIITELTMAILLFANTFSAVTQPPSAVTVKSPRTLEASVRDYFTKAPILSEIARCESQFRHFGKNGNIIRGITNIKDVGVMQINEEYHRDKAETLGMDIYSLDGNLEYAKYLFEKEGTRPWRSSAKCWNRELTKV
ncbi:MAG: hypothetical protein A3I97_00495 [Candidatus Taylorbacteria bacterium RIFCSPLOWO2_02_FULL_44_35]|nr:MAG: hypothetical protein A3I97_00495 [Candidatus Taylorbacteria bacterium RIFCSPLOWO2_02_FULL_44_35]